MITAQTEKSLIFMRLSIQKKRKMRPKNPMQITITETLAMILLRLTLCGFSLSGRVIVLGQVEVSIAQCCYLMIQSVVYMKKQTEPPSPLGKNQATEPPKVNRNCLFFNNKPIGSQPQIEPNRQLTRQSLYIDGGGKRQRYSSFQRGGQVPQEIRRLRNSEDLYNRHIKVSQSQDRVSDKGRIMQIPRGNIVHLQRIQRVTSFSQKSVNLKREIVPREEGMEDKEAKDDGDQKALKSQTACKMTLQDVRKPVYNSIKKIRQSRLRRERHSDILHVRKSLSLRNQNIPECSHSQPRVNKSSSQQVAALDVSHLMLIQSVLSKVCQSVRQQSKETSQLCLCYITLQKDIQQNLLFQLLQEHRHLLKQLLVLQRMVVYLSIYYQKNPSTTTKRNPRQMRSPPGLHQLVISTFKVHSVMTDLILEVLTQTKKLDLKRYRIKEIGKETKLRKVLGFLEAIKKGICEIVESQQGSILELFGNLLRNSYKIESFEYISVIDKTLKWEILELPSFPFLPPATKQHTLILDLDQTLVHFNPKTQKLQIRPYAEEFMIRMSRLFELVIFTAGTKNYADDLIDRIDTHSSVSFRLYRNHITIVDGNPVKNLSLLGRDLNNTLIIDNVEANFKLHPDNGILISSWYGDLKDDTLQKVQNILKNAFKLHPSNLVSGVLRWGDYIKEHVSYSSFICELSKDL